MTSRLVAVALDCRDPEALAAFWCAALDYRVRERWSDAVGTGYVETGDDDGALLLFQPVREDKAVKNRLHLDIAPVQGSQADEMARLLGLGASLLDGDPTLSPDQPQPEGTAAAWGASRAHPRRPGHLEGRNGRVKLETPG